MSLDPTKIRRIFELSGTQINASPLIGNLWIEVNTPSRLQAHKKPSHQSVIVVVRGHLAIKLI